MFSECKETEDLNVMTETKNLSMYATLEIMDILLVPFHSTEASRREYNIESTRLGLRKLRIRQVPHRITASMNRGMYVGFIIDNI
jgi:hypothetical protein